MGDFGGDYPEERIYQEEDTKADLTAPYYYINEYMDGFKELVQECQPFDPPLPNHTWWRIPKDQKELERFYLYYNDSFVHLTYPYMEYKNYGENYIQEYDELDLGGQLVEARKISWGTSSTGFPVVSVFRNSPSKAPLDSYIGILWQATKGRRVPWAIGCSTLMPKQERSPSLKSPSSRRDVGMKGTGSGYWVEGRGVLVFLLGLVEIEVINSRKIFKIFQKINRIVSSFL